MGRAVNPLAHAFEGSNPSPSNSTLIIKVLFFRGRFRLAPFGTEDKLVLEHDEYRALMFSSADWGRERAVIVPRRMRRAIIERRRDGGGATVTHFSCNQSCPLNVAVMALAMRSSTSAEAGRTFPAWSS